MPKRQGERSARRAKSPLLLAVKLLIVVALSCVPACWGKLELEERSFITLLGVDSIANGNLLITAVVAVPRAMGGGGRMAGGGGVGTGALMLSAQGKDVSQALDNMELLSSRHLTTVHMAFVVLGEGFAGTDVGPIIDIFSRSLEFRHNTLVAVCRGRAIDFLQDYQSIEESEPSQYLLKLVTTSYEVGGACPLVTMHEFMVGYNTVSVEPWAPYVEIASAAPAERPAVQPPQQAAGAAAGGQAAGAETAEPTRVIKIVGAALFKKVGDVQKMVGYLDTEESQAALLMQGTFHSGRLTLLYPGDQTEATLVIHHVSSRPHAKVVGEALNVKFEIRIEASLHESVVGRVEVPEKDPEFRQRLVFAGQDRMVAVLRRTFDKLTVLGSDVIGFGRLAEPSFASYGEWEAFDWPSRFKDTTAVFDVKMHVLTVGYTATKPFPR